MNLFQPGRELDALVSEKIFGAAVDQRLDGPHVERVTRGVSVTIIDSVPLPMYSSDIAAAWEVVELLNDRWNVSIACRESQPVEVFVVLNGAVGENPEFYAEADTAPHAICLAALRAAGVDVPS